MQFRMVRCDGCATEIATGAAAGWFEVERWADDDESDDEDSLLNFCSADCLRDYASGLGNNASVPLEPPANAGEHPPTLDARCGLVAIEAWGQAVANEDDAAWSTMRAGLRTNEEWQAFALDALRMSAMFFRYVADHQGRDPQEFSEALASAWVLASAGDEPLGDLDAQLQALLDEEYGGNDAH